MIQLPGFNAAAVPAGGLISVAVPQAEPLNFAVAATPWSVVVFTAPSGGEGGPVSISWGDIEEKPTFAAVATSGSYGDLSGRPTLGTAAARDIGTSAGQVRDAADAAYTNARAPTSHTHPLTDLTQSGAATRQVLEWSGTAWAGATPPFYVVNTSARSAQIPDNTAAGGNARGPNSTDLQSSRGSASQVASGSGAKVGGGRSNTASGSDTTVAGGSGNSATGERATVSGGEVNTASGARAVISGGSFNTASSPNSFIPGGTAATVLGIIGAHAWQAQNRGAAGDNQHFGALFGATTTDATATVLTANRSTPSTAAGMTNVFVLPNNSVWDGTVRVVARSTSGGVHKWSHEVSVSRGANAAATTVVDSHLVRQANSSLSGVSISIAANTTRGSLEVTATGVSATEIDWTCEFLGVMNYR